MGVFTLSSVVAAAFRPRLLVSALFVLCSVTLVSAQAQNSNAAAQTVEVKNEIKAKPTGTTAGFSEYRKVMIGTESSAVKEMLGDPKVEDADGFVYQPTDNEMVQIVLGPDKKVRTISITYSEGVGAPTFQQVFGSGAKPEKKENGSVHRIVRYPEAGYWVSYFAGTGQKPSVTVTIQKL